VQRHFGTDSDGDESRDKEAAAFAGEISVANEGMRLAVGQ